MAVHNHPPDHDHAHCRTTALARAEERCLESGARLTAIRRRVLDVVLDKHQPVGAYDIIERLVEKGHERAAPVTIYRALEFLVQQGFVHRVESRNAYVACTHSHATDETVVLLVCETCDEVSELSTSAIAETIAAAAGRVGFLVRQPVIEIVGRCKRCNGLRNPAQVFNQIKPKPLAV